MPSIGVPIMITLVAETYQGISAGKVAGATGVAPGKSKLLPHPLMGSVTRIKPDIPAVALVGLAIVPPANSQKLPVERSQAAALVIVRTVW